MNIAALTALDVYVVVALALLATGMWVGRRFVGALLKLMPAFFAVLGTAGAYLIYRVGESLNWDTPGSPGILIVFLALIAAVIIAITAWIALILQIRRLRKPAVPRSPERAATMNGIRVAFAIVFVVWGLFSTYRYVRSHWPSHDASVVQVVYSPDGAFLYSLDELGILKKWNVEHRFEADKWELPAQVATNGMLVSEDGVLVTLQGDVLTSWDLAMSPVARIATQQGVMAIVAAGAGDFWRLAGDELSLHSYRDISAPKFARALGFGASSISAYADLKVVVGARDGGLRFYAAQPAGLVEIDVQTPPLDIYPRRIRADRNGRFLVVSDGEKMTVLDLQTLRQGPIPESSSTERFEISGAGTLLLEAVGITKYGLATASLEPFFNHGGIATVAISPIGDAVAIADRREIYMRPDTRGYASAELWLNGRVEVAVLVSRIRR